MIGTKNPTSRTDRPERYDDGGRGMMPGASVGAALRERREALGASLAEVEAATKIRQKYLSALEADEWQLLPGEVVGRGFLRNYATYLGLEPTEIIERRRAIADPSLSSALAPTSAGSELPPMRQVDYRPKDVGLRDEPDTLEERTPLNLRPLFAVMAGIAALLLLVWGFNRFGGGMVNGFTSAGAGASARVAALFASRPDPTPTRSLAVVAAGAQPTSTSVFDAAPAEAGNSDSAASGQSNDAAADTSRSEAVDPLAADPLAAVPAAAVAVDAAQGATPAPAATLPPPTPTFEPPTPTLIPPTPTPLPQAVTVATQANLRAAPSLDGEIVGAAQVGDQINIIGQTADAQWYLLDNNGWIFAQLAGSPTAPVPVVDPASIAAPESVLLPTATPIGAEAATPAAEPVVEALAAACTDARSVISSPTEGQGVSGFVDITGNATHEAFASFKLEAGAPGSALDFVGSGNSPVSGGALGNVNTAAFPNGPLLIRLTVIDQTGNFPPVCDVTVNVQN